MRFIFAALAALHCPYPWNNYEAPNTHWIRLLADCQGVNLTGLAVIITLRIYVIVKPKW